MGNIAYRIQTSTKFAAPAAIHSILAAIAPAGHGLKVVEFGISFDGVTAANVPVDVEICQSTQGAAGTPGVSPTPVQIRGRSSGGSAPTAGSNYTGEPTTQTSLAHYFVTPNAGLFVYQFPLGNEIECDSSGGTVKAIILRSTPPNTVDVYAYMDVEAIG